ncbi:MAG: alpha-2-macroglobulin family protein [Bacteroidia bacterium]
MRLRLPCIALIWFILSLYNSIMAQNLLTSPRSAVEGQVYRLTLEQAEMAARGRIDANVTEWLGNRVESFPANGNHSPLTPGQYLVTKVVGNQVQWTYKQVPGYSVILENDGANLMVKVMDFAGKDIEDAIVLVEGQFIPYDPRTRSYSLPSSSITQTTASLLEVDASGIVQFYSLTQTAPTKPAPEYNRRYYGESWAWRWLWAPTKRFVINPIIRTVMLPYDIARSIIKRRLFGWPAWLWYRTKWLIGLPKQALTERHPVAFLITNQPKYRPGDTVKFKGYVTNRRGSRLTRRLDLLYTDRFGKTRSLASIKPEQPGSYNGAFVLHDSLNLQMGATVSLILTDRKIWGNNSVYAQSWRYTSTISKVLNPGTNFVYEDYELRAYTFHARAEQTTHWAGKPGAVYLEAKDMNNLTVPDARVKLWVRSGTLKRWMGPREILRDTIWTWEGLLDPSGETRIEIPIERFPKASFDYSVQLECRTSDNELKSQTLQLSYIYDMPTLEVIPHGDSIHITQLRSNVAEDVEAKLTFFPSANGEPILERTVRLPITLYWPPNFRSLMVVTREVNKAWSPSDAAPVWIRGRHAGDSLHIWAESPAGVDFAYRLFEGNKEIAAGHGPRVQVHRRAHSHPTYHFVAIYLVNGTEHQESKSFRWAKKDLQVTWEGPQTIYPGQTVDMALRVQNARGRAVRRADLTAYAVNGRFGGHDPVGIPSASKGPKSRREQGKWQNGYRSSSNGYMKLAYNEWSTKVGLDSLPWYQFLYRDSHGYRYLHPIEKERTEVAPFLVRNGEIQPTQIVYIDGEPRYFAWSNPQMPYSFAVTPGLHRIEIRLPDFGVLIDTFHVINGRKNIFSFDLDHLPKRIMAKPMQNSPVPGEKQIIDARTMAYRGVNATTNPVFVGGGRSWVPLANGYSSGYLVGPIPLNGYPTFEALDKFKYEFPLESGFEFDFGPTYVKMRSIDLKTKMPTQFNYRPNLTIEDRAWLRDSVEARWRRANPTSNASTSLGPTWSNGSNSRQPSSAPRQTWARTWYSWGLEGRLDVSFNEITQLSAPKDALVFTNDLSNKMFLVQYNAGELRVPTGKWAMYLLLADDKFVELDSVNIPKNTRQHLEFTIRSYQVKDSFRVRHAELVRKYFPQLPSNTMIDLGPVEPFVLKSPNSHARFHVKGQVFDGATREAVPYAAVYSTRTKAGVITSEDGQFDLPLDVSPDTLVVRSMGYFSTKIPWNGAKWLEIGLDEEGVMLQEVEVQDHIRYERLSVDASASRSMDMQVSSNIQEVLVLNSGVDIISIRGGRDRGTPVILDGSQAGNGEMAQAPEFPKELMEEIAGTSTLRKDFRDGAVWEPALRSDRHGRAAFRVRFPEDITRWDAYGIAVDRRGRTGLTKTMVNSWKPLMGRLAMPRFFYEGDTVNVIGKVMNYTGDTLEMRRVFKVGDRELSRRLGACGPVALDTLAVMPDMRQDSFILSYMTDKADGYGDGEQWGVRVFPQGVKQADGEYTVLFGDTTYKLPAFDPSKGEVHIRLNTQIYNLLLQATERMSSYEHLCNEQLASKLLALLMEERMYKALGKIWEGKEDVNKILAMYKKRLEPNSDGWGWWPGMKTEVWVSAHVSKALTEAKKMGYVVPLHSVNWPSIHLSKLDKRNPYNNLEVLELVQSLDSTINIRQHVEALDTCKYWQIYHKLRVMELRQKVGLSIAVDSLMGWSTQHAAGMLSWGYGTMARRYLPDLGMTLCAYRILRRAGKSTAELQDILAFVLNQRSYNGWGNTYLTADVLTTLAGDVNIERYSKQLKSTLLLDGVPMQLPGDTAFTLPAGKRIEIRQEGLGLSYFTAYQEWFERNPSRIDSIFEVTTRFRNAPDNRLEAGKPVTLEVTVKFKKAAEYLMLEIPIPSSCSYYHNGPSYNSGRWNGDYRENFRQKTCIYLRQAYPGTHTFEVDLLPRYTGTFNLNPARIEDMYHPTIAGQTTIDRVEVK